MAHVVILKHFYLYWVRAIDAEVLFCYKVSCVVNGCSGLEGCSMKYKGLEMGITNMRHTCNCMLFNAD